MGYMGRGSSSSGGNNSSDNSHSSSRGNGIGLTSLFVSGMLYSSDEDYDERRRREEYYNDPRNRLFVIAQVISFVVIIIILALSYLYSYKSPIIDPIASLKSNVLNIHTISIFGLLVSTMLTNYFSKDRNALIKRLFFILILAVLVLMISLVVKLDMNTKYTEEKFSQIYVEEYANKDSIIREDYKEDIMSVAFGSGLANNKEYFVKECVKLYNLFNIKTYILIGLNLLLIVLEVHQISKAIKLKKKKDEIDLENKVLFDDVQNVKY